MAKNDLLFGGLEEQLFAGTRELIVHGAKEQLVGKGAKGLVAGGWSEALFGVPGAVWSALWRRGQ
jgi:hypothetical protein